MEVVLSHPRRIYYPDKRISKEDVALYYRELAPLILPYLRDRPQVLHRFPAGIDDEGFYQKDNPQAHPPWVEKAAVFSEHNQGDIEYLLCQNPATLLYLVNLGCQELNPWNSRLAHLDHPDWLILDLDPLEVPFGHVVQVAQTTHRMLESARIAHYCKTSGKKGLHIFIPLGARYRSDTVRQLAEAIAALVHAELPRITSLARSPSQRRRRVYLDYLQNGYGKTLAAPYSLRPVAFAGVSTPLHWDEVNEDLDPRQFNFFTIRERLEKLGDLWAPVIGPGVDLAALIAAAS